MQIDKVADKKTTAGSAIGFVVLVNDGRNVTAQSVFKDAIPNAVIQQMVRRLREITEALERRRE